MLPKNDPPAPAAPDKVVTKPILTENSPWTMHWEIADGHTTLTARLNKRLEFRIVCDRVKLESPDGALMAIGKVHFTGPGMKGKCDRLTISLVADSLVLDGKAELQVQQGNLADLAIPIVEPQGRTIHTAAAADDERRAGGADCAQHAAGIDAAGIRRAGKREPVGAQPVYRPPRLPIAGQEGTVTVGPACRAGPGRF